MRIRKRGWLFALIGPVPQAVGYVGGPLAISRLGRRHGWRHHRPSAGNLAGLAPLVVGAGVIGAAIAGHEDTAPEDMKLAVVPEYLVTTGIYGRTRNPMYLGGALMQTGWAILLGSLPVAGACAAFLLCLDRLGIPFEERLLVARHGAAYDEYRRRVPRWLGPLPTRPRDRRG